MAKNGKKDLLRHEHQAHAEARIIERKYILVQGPSPKALKRSLGQGVRFFHAIIQKILAADGPCQRRSVSIPPSARRKGAADLRCHIRTGRSTSRAVGLLPTRCAGAALGRGCTAPRREPQRCSRPTAAAKFD